MSVISAQSTARKFPPQIPTRTTTTKTASATGAARRSAMPGGAERAARPDDPLAADPVGERAAGTSRSVADDDDQDASDRSRLPRRARSSAEASVQVEARTDDQDAPPSGWRGVTRPATGSSARGGCPCPTPRRDAPPRAALARLRGRPSRTRKTRAASSRTRGAEHETPSAKLPVAVASAATTDAGDDARGPASVRPVPLASPTWRRRHEVRDVALERALREVGAELEETRRTQATSARARGDADRNTRSSIVPMRMYGLRRPSARPCSR